MVTGDAGGYGGVVLLLLASIHSDHCILSACVVGAMLRCACVRYRKFNKVSLHCTFGSSTRIRAIWSVFRVWNSGCAFCVRGILQKLQMVSFFEIRFPNATHHLISSLIKFTSLVHAIVSNQFDLVTLTLWNALTSPVYEKDVLG